jgi:hypothetical protein
MSRVLSESAAWLRRQAWSYLMILAVLVAGSWLLAEYRRSQALTAQAEQAASGVQQQQAEVARAKQRAHLAEQALQGQLAVLRSARDAAQQQLRSKERERDQHAAKHWPWAGLHGPEALAESKLLDEQVKVLALAVRAAQDRLDAGEATRTSATSLQQLQVQARQPARRSGPPAGAVASAERGPSDRATDTRCPGGRRAGSPESGSRTAAA